MLTVSDAFLAAWRNPAAKFEVHRIKYKRRYAAGGAFVYEADWNTLEMKNFVQLGDASSTLDTVTGGVFNASNIVLSLRNNRYEWSPYNQAGVFGSDAVATAGYQAYRTLFQIEAGYLLPDGTAEVPVQFTGYMVDFSMSPDKGIFEATISGKELDFKENDAQKVSAAFTEEATSPAIGNGVITDFYTTSVGVGFVNQVRVGGVVKKEGVDYTISETGEYNKPAKISFNIAPAAGEGNIDTSGIKWLTGQKIEELAEAICDYCGITDRIIEEVLFPNLVASVKTIDDQADWQNTGYVKTLTDTSTAPGDVTTALLAIPPLTADSLSYGTALTINYNSASWCVLLNRADGLGTFTFLFDNFVSATLNGRPAYYIKRVYSGYDSRIELWRTDPRTSPTPSVQTLLGVTSWQNVNNNKNILITRDASTGRIYVKQKDDPSYIDVTDTTYNATTFDTSFLYGATGDYAMVLPNVVDTVNGVFKADQCTYESGEHDLLVVPDQWGVFTTYATLNGGTVAVQTRTAPTSGGTYEAYSALTAGGVVQSTLSRWFKFKLTFNHQAWNYLSPVVNKVTIDFYSATVAVALADFSGQNCYQALQTLAGIFNGEIGFTGAGVFFFRTKSTSATPVLTLNQKQIVRISSFKPGWNEVRNNCQVSYDPYYKEYNSVSAGESFPTSKDIYNDRIENKSMGGFMLANDADIATGMAQIGYEAKHVAKRRVRLQCKLIPFLELSDVIQVAYYEDPLLESNVFGDPMQKFAPAFGESQAVLLRDVVFKVVGINQQYKSGITDLQLEEIL
jgi:hypothetical protein